jgi:hypothetical protein
MDRYECPCGGANPNCFKCDGTGLLERPPPPLRPPGWVPSLPATSTESTSRSPHIYPPRPAASAQKPPPHIHDASESPANEPVARSKKHAREENIAFKILGQHFHATSLHLAGASKADLLCWNCGEAISTDRTKSCRRCGKPHTLRSLEPAPPSKISGKQRPENANSLLVRAPKSAGTGEKVAQPASPQVIRSELRKRWKVSGTTLINTENNDVFKITTSKYHSKDEVKFDGRGYEFHLSAKYVYVNEFQVEK